MPTTKLGYVLSSAATSIVVRIETLKDFEEHKAHLQIGQYLQIAEGNHDSVIAVIRNLRASSTMVDASLVWSFDVECQPVGTLIDGKAFERGSSLLPVPMEPAFRVTKETLDLIFAAGTKYNCPFGPLAMNKDINLMIDADAFYSKHIAVVGSTGSGKSCAVARMLQDAIGIAKAKNRHVACQKNSHVIIFDCHSEYKRAFDLAADQVFTLNCLDVETLRLPYWLMNSEELESLFIESNEANSHNQVSQFKHAVIANKTTHNPAVKEMTYDCPVYFSIREVLNYIENMNREVIGRLEGENCPKLSDNTFVTNREARYFEKILTFVPNSTAAASRATNGPFNGEFNRFVSRLETTLADKRLKFLLDPRKPNATPYKTGDFEDIIKQFLGYLTKSNVTIVDLSGVPFEVMSIVVSLVSRMVFDFSVHYSKLRQKNGHLNDVPLLVVCEEAHNYVPRTDSAAYRSSKKSLERIAKEGRKYGIGLMVVSQRPSEVSDTIFAQCNNFVALRLTNSDDQAYVKHLIPNNINGITDALPNLGQGECVVVGDAILMPAIVKLGLPDPQPQSEGIKVFTEWGQDWKHVTFSDIVKRWQADAGGPD